MLMSTWNISILARPLVGLLALVWLKMQIHSLPLGAAFGALKIAVFPGNTVHKAALHSQTLLYQALQARWNENETNRTNHRRLASRKNESLSKSLGVVEQIR